MGKYSDSLLGGMQPVAETAAPAGRYSSDLLGTPQSEMEQPRADVERAPTAVPPQGASVIQGVIGSIKGKQDPTYAGTGTVFEQFPGELRWPTANAATLGASDEQMADIIQKSLGDRFIRREKDANGYDVFVTLGPNGEEQRGYVNAPGLDTQDVSRSIYGSLPYLATGFGVGAATRGAGMAAQALSQGLGAGATSVAGDVAQIPMGSEQGIELGKAGVMTGLGAAGPVLSGVGANLWRRFVTEPKYFNRVSGQLTPLGEQAVRQAGLDPAALTPELQKTFAKTYAQNPKEAASAVNAVTDTEFGIPSTLGERTKDPAQLMREKAMRHDVYGPQAKSILDEADEAQKKAVERVVRETFPGTIEGEPVQAPLTATPGELGERVGSGLSAAQKAAKAQEQEAWKKTGPVSVLKEEVQEPDRFTPMTGRTKTVTQAKALPQLAESIKTHLGDLADVYGPEMTPTAYKMGQYLDRFLKGKAPSTELHSAFKLKRTDSIDSVRKAIGLMVPDAETGADKAASKAVYRALDDWMTKAADDGLLSGDLAAVKQFRTARDITKEMRGIFEPSQGGSLTPGGKVIEKIVETGDTPERVVSLLFSGPKTDIKPGTIEAITNIKKGLDRYLDPARAKEVWNDIRLAHWSRLFQGGNGEVLGKDALKANLKHALNKQSTLINLLYTPQEIAQLRRFVSELERITYKDPNPSGTATGVAVFAKQFVGKLLDAFGGAGRTAFEFSGIPRAYGTNLAKRAVSTKLGAPRPNTSASVALPALGQPYSRKD